MKDKTPDLRNELIVISLSFNVFLLIVLAIIGGMK